MQPLADARRYGHKEICTILEAYGGYVKSSTSAVEYEIDPAELGLEKAKPVGKVHVVCVNLLDILPLWELKKSSSSRDNVIPFSSARKVV